MKLKELETKLDNTDSVEELRFTPKDILLKRDIDFINKDKKDLIIIVRRIFLHKNFNFFSKELETP